MEVWKPVVGFGFDDPHLEVSSMGNIRRTDLDTLRVYGARDYVIVRPRSQDGKLRSHNLHRLVALFHIGPPPFEGALVRHKDGKGRLGDKSDNSASNLEWGSSADNMEDARRDGTLAIGSRQGLSKLTEEDVAGIKARILGGEQISEIAKDYEVAGTAISSILHDRTWTHVPWPDGAYRRLCCLRAKHVPKLDWNIADEIRRRVVLGERQVDLAREFGCTKASIQDILNGNSYADSGKSVEQWAETLGRPIPGRRLVTQENVAEIIKRIDAGESPNAVGASLRFSRQTIVQAFIKATGRKPSRTV